MFYIKIQIKIPFSGPLSHPIRNERISIAVTPKLKKSNVFRGAKEKQLANTPGES